MAEIKVQRKERGKGWWPFLVLVLLLIPVIWLVTRDRTAVDPVASDTSASTSVVGGDVAPRGDQSSRAFAAFVAAPDTARSEAAQHRYAAEGLRRLADAIAERGAQAGGMERVRSLSDSLQNSAGDSRRHSNNLRLALAEATQAMRSVPGVDQARVNAMRDAADAINVEQPLLDQREALRRYFEAARDALNAAGGAATPMNDTSTMRR